MGMKRGIRTASVLTLVAVIIIAFYMYLTRMAGQREERKETQAVTETEKLLNLDFKKNYPPTPREVIKYYDRFALVLFGEKKPSQSNTTKLASKLRELFDDDLANANPEKNYAAALWSQVQDFKERKARIVQADVCDTDDVVYKTVNGRDVAYVQVTYLVKEADSYSSTYQKFVLRKDKDDNWKILGYTRTDKDGNPVSESNKKTTK
ncbi:MAG: hypothetical protein DUD27_06940 [Lachnospiraceae bacterium]|uniref:Uncharacterized protein n=1 Tax=Candidatus Weimeria bifida TaxID=2599074 RepID=A0A6N7J289_9FIRM|nr:hypothetical protein [Candidatus Weimeria bifida]RRF95890.1 MAG: hypothetical protein DUD27_06940 [Lachnospiraceae bacterium]